ncbi:hypothetical protein HN709_03375 [Candidatus Peregrinibacteria bacterium]|jgi:hypothetical protein|nr:hypothetical protein [Candidatus Peregrinibacteria bacterium]MBT7736706.1 hypothetical protein [Candidatus Peregrinibacteria bacterium]
MDKSEFLQQLIDTDGPQFEEGQVDRCADGECCTCGVCCIAFQVDVPAVGELQGIFRKEALEICPHMVIDDTGFKCGLHGNKGEDPRLDRCQNFRGDEMAVSVNERFRTNYTCYEWVFNAYLGTIYEKGNAEDIAIAEMMARRGTLPFVIDMEERMGRDWALSFVRRIIRMRQSGEWPLGEELPYKLFEYIGLGQEFLDMIEKGEAEKAADVQKTPDQRGLILEDGISSEDREVVDSWVQVVLDVARRIREDNK